MPGASGKTYEMLWDCQFCGTAKLLGKTHRFCPNCGAPQNPAARYYPSDDEKVAVEDHIFVGADKTCGSCGQLNAGNAEFCQQCGAPLAGAAGAKVVAAQTRAEGEAFQAGAPRDVTREAFDAEMQRVGVQKKKNTGPNWTLYAALGVVALVVVGIIAALLWTRETTVFVSGHEWSREIRIEQYDNFTTQSWWDAPPMGDGVVRGLCTQRQRSTRQVPDGEECSTVRVDQGDGTYREERQCRTRYRDEPVYDDWCTFTGRRWDYERSVTTSGRSLRETPAWGVVTLNCASQARVGCEREAGREEIYTVIFTGDENRTYRCPFPQAQWQAAGIESVWSVNVRVVDAGAADCNSLKPKN
ncbi:MAG: zinc ribbon domain-containing protein [Anaerolineae bacterium]|nr:zinc ribbon domain-containing protein [Anaerolineae bacterium]